MAPKKRQPLARQAFLGADRRPRIVRCEQCGFPDSASPVWTLGILDMDGRWGWSATSQDHLRRVRERLSSFETMTWTRIEQGTGSHQVGTDRLVKDARDRLTELGQDDIDQLFSLRIQGKIRVWGIRDGAALKVLWFDPHHEVCPSLPSN